MATIQQGSFIEFHMRIYLKDGSVADDSRQQQMPYGCRIGDGRLTQKVEQRLMGKTVGDQVKVMQRPEETFGLPRTELIHHMPKTDFSPEVLEIGTIVGFSQPNGQSMPGMIREIQDQQVVVDFNHPLAGHVALFELEILAVSNEGAE